jgi:hypothetical protein
VTESGTLAERVVGVRAVAGSDGSR